MTYRGLTIEMTPVDNLRKYSYNNAIQLGWRWKTFRDGEEILSGNRIGTSRWLAARSAKWQARKLLRRERHVERGKKWVATNEDGHEASR